MRILMLTHTYFPSVGGGIRYKKAVVDHFRAKGHTVDVLAVSTDKNMAVDPDAAGTVIRMPQWVEANSSAIAPGYFAAFGRLAPRYDVLLFNFPNPMCELSYLMHARKLKHARKVCMYHADIVPAKRMSGPYNRLVTRPYLAGMDSIVVSSPKIVDSSPHLAPFRDKIEIIPFGIDPELFELAAGTTTRRGAEDDVSILFVGRLSRYKGIDHLIRAIADAPGRLRIVGRGPLGPGLEALAAELGVTDRVTFLGGVDDDELLEEYHRADVLVLPSTDAGEAFGYVLIEAMMCGAATISTELGTGTSFVNQHEESGLVVPPGDSNALAAALRRLHEDRALLRRLQKGAYERAHTHFTINRMLEQTASVLAP